MRTLFRAIGIDVPENVATEEDAGSLAAYCILGPIIQHPHIYKSEKYVVQLTPKLPHPNSQSSLFKEPVMIMMITWRMPRVGSLRMNWRMTLWILRPLSCLFKTVRSCVQQTYQKHRGIVIRFAYFAGTGKTFGRCFGEDGPHASSSQTTGDQAHEVQ